jgi:CRISPR type IV-associated protein Csf3
MSAAAYMPLLVRARLQAGIAHAAPWGIALDGLLASQLWADRKAAARAAGGPVPGLPADGAEPEDLDLPLSRCELGGPGQWHWAATCAWPESPAAELPDVRYWMSHIDERACAQAAAALPAAIPARQGRYRARRMPLLATVCPSVTWHAVGDPAAIRALLATVLAIGKKRSHGEGRVLAWEVTPAAAGPWAAAHLHPDGALGRPAPPACLAGRAVTARGRGTAGLRPPYMHPARQQELCLPAR